MEQGGELVKQARRDGESFDCAAWLRKWEENAQGGFKGEVERQLTGKEPVPREIIYVNLYKSQ